MFARNDITKFDHISDVRQTIIGIDKTDYCQFNIKLNVIGINCHEKQLKPPETTRLYNLATQAITTRQLRNDVVQHRTTTR